MKKTLSIVLMMCLLLSLLLPVASAREGKGTTADAPYDVSFDPSAVEIREASRAQDLVSTRESRGDTRDTREDNLVFPGPLMKQSTVRPNMQESFALGMYYSGKPGQYYVMMIYEGSAPQGDAVLTTYAPFETDKLGYTTKIINEKTTNFKPGRYTVVTFTAEPKNNTLYAIDDTVYMTDIYCYEAYQKRWSIFAQDIDTGAKIDVLNMVPGEFRTISMGRAPLPSDGNGVIRVECPQGILEIEEAGGYIFLAAVACGSGSLLITHDDTKIVEVPVHVCTRAGGHQATSTYTPLEPTRTEEGLNVHICKTCGTLYRQSVVSLEKSFAMFTDLPKDAWYYTFVQDAYYLRLFNGVSDTAFKPEQAMTRAMLVTVLWRAQGSPEGATSRFDDVPDGSWYAEAVNWAAENQIVNGVGHGRFNPEGKITREQMAAILYRYSQMLALPNEKEDAVSTFVDGDQVSSWAIDAMNWNIAYGMIGGVKQDNIVYLAPQGDATRAQVSAILVRFLNAFREPEPEVELPDVTTAMDHGKWGDLSWAFYSDGTLRVGGSGSMADVSSGADCPWYTYADRIVAVELLYGVTNVGAYVFANYKGLKTLTLADTVSTIGNRAFFGCGSLSTVHMSEGITLIGSSAFESCTSLEAIDFPYGLKQIYDRAFALCTALKEVVLPDSIVGYNKGKNVPQIEGVGREAFIGCTSLEHVTLPYAIRRIADRTFFDCTSLKEVWTPLCLEYVETKSFSNCSSLESIVFYTNISQVSIGSFENCTSLKSVYVLSPYYTIVDRNNHWNIGDESQPFGNPKRVTLYGIVGSATEEIAKERGYKFVDILTVAD